MIPRHLQHKIDLLAVRQEKTITVASAEQYDPGFPPSPILEFQEWFDHTLAEIPAEFRAAATIEIESTSSYYDSHYAEVTISYRRPETDEEFEARKVEVNREVAEYERQRQQAAELLTPGNEVVLQGIPGIVEPTRFKVIGPA